MAEIVNSLFGLDKLGIQQQIMQEQDAMARTIAQGSLTPGRAYVGARIGQALGGALAKGLFGVEDPRLAKAAKLEAAMQQVNSSLTEEDRANPANLYLKLSQTLAQDPDLQREALMAQEKAQELGLAFAKTKSEITKNLREKDPSIEAWKTLAGKSTPESVKDSIESGYDFNKLKPAKEDNLAAGPAYVKAVNTLIDPNAGADEKKQAFATYQMLFPAVTNGAFGQYIPQFGPAGIQFAPAPGSPEAQKVTETAEKKVKQLTSAYNKSDVITSNINEALKYVNPKTTGSVGQATRALPFSGSSDAARLAGYIDTIKANIGFDQLQKMRTESPTGGALGQVAVKELDFLQAALGNLNPDLPDDMVKQQLNKVLTHYNNFMAELEKEMQAVKAKVPQPAGQPQAPQSPQATGGKRVTVDGKTFEQLGPNQWREVMQ